MTARRAKHDTDADRLAEQEQELQQLRAELADLQTSVRSEKLGEVAQEFEHVHNIERARSVGSVDAIIPAQELRPYLIAAVERGLGRATRGPASESTS